MFQVWRPCSPHRNWKTCWQCRLYSWRVDDSFTCPHYSEKGKISTSHDNDRLYSSVDGKLYRKPLCHLFKSSQMVSNGSTALQVVSKCMGHSSRDILYWQFLLSFYFIPQANLQLGLLDEVDEAMEAELWQPIIDCLIITCPRRAWKITGRCSACDILASS